MMSRSLMLGLVPALFVAACSEGDRGNGTASTGGAGGAGGAGAGSGGASGGSTATGGTAGSGATTGGSAGAGGSVMQDPSSVRTGGPPCLPGRGASLGDLTLEPLFSVENTQLHGGLVVTDAGVFWLQGLSVERLPHAGGTPEVVATGEYRQIVPVGTDLLLVERGDPLAQTDARLLFRVASSAAEATPDEVGSTIDGDRVVLADDAYAYVHNSGASTMARIAFSDGAREELVADTYVDAPTIAGDFIYFIGLNEDIHRVPKTGGTPERIGFVPHIPWSLRASGDTLLVGAWESVHVMPIAGGDYVSLAGFSAVGLDGAGYVEDMIPAGDRFFLQTSDAYIAWIANDGTTCQGLVSPSLSFGYRAIFEGYLYVVDSNLGTLAVSRVALPQ